MNTQLNIITQEMFADELNERVHRYGMTYVDAILDICEKKNIEIESIPKLLNAKTRKIIQAEATNMNMLKKKAGRKLPI